MFSQPVSSLDLSTLSSGPGVYIFRDDQHKIIYIGKAKNLKNRLESYFRPPALLGLKTVQMMGRAFNLEYIEVGSELEALLLEARLINQKKPFYNIISKDDKSPYFVHISRGEFPKPIINHDQKKAIAGPFLNSQVPRRILHYFRHIAPFCTAPKTAKRACLYSHIGLCSPCPHGENFLPTDYKQNIRKLRMLLSGKFGIVKKALGKEMAMAAKQQQYEKAAEIRNHLNYLNELLTRPIMPETYINDPDLEIDKRREAVESLEKALNKYIPVGNLNRIETYDIANLNGKEATAAMTVAENGFVNSQKYRHFKIKTVQGPNDPAMLSEVLGRRLKNNWPRPDLIVLDGGKSQLSIVLGITPPPPLKLRGGVGEGDNKDGLGIPVIGLAKQKETIVIPYQSEYLELNLPKNNPGLQLLQHLRDEAHRFSRRLHHRYRSAKMYA